MGEFRIKYEKIMQISQEKYLKTGDIEGISHGECLHELDKAGITNKIKKTCLYYRTTIDLGKMSGGGRIIMTIFDLFQNIRSQLLQVYPLVLIHLWFLFLRRIP